MTKKNEIQATAPLLQTRPVRSAAITAAANMKSTLGSIKRRTFDGLEPRRVKRVKSNSLVAIKERERSGNSQGSNASGLSAHKITTSRRKNPNRTRAKQVEPVQNRKQTIQGSRDTYTPKTIGVPSPFVITEHGIWTDGNTSDFTMEQFQQAAELEDRHIATVKEILTYAILNEDEMHGLAGLSTAHKRARFRQIIQEYVDAFDQDIIEKLNKNKATNGWHVYNMAATIMGQYLEPLGEDAQISDLVPTTGLTTTDPSSEKNNIETSVPSLDGLPTQGDQVPREVTRKGSLETSVIDLKGAEIETQGNGSIQAKKRVRRPVAPSGASTTDARESNEWRKPDNQNQIKIAGKQGRKRKAKVQDFCAENTQEEQCIARPKRRKAIA
ncbi:hypothetical protein ABW19_dt0201736 [Dactylella cylindrospora]|nr:hypothetical protein ABW19_dt0201736 [Dactylella cylindrospora]